MPELSNKNKEQTVFCRTCDKFLLVEAETLRCYNCGKDLIPWHN